MTLNLQSSPVLRIQLILMRIRIQEAKILRIQRIRILSTAEHPWKLWLNIFDIHVFLFENRLFLFVASLWIFNVETMEKIVSSKNMTIYSILSDMYIVEGSLGFTTTFQVNIGLQTYSWETSYFLKKNQRIAQFLTNGSQSFSYLFCTPPTKKSCF